MSQIKINLGGTEMNLEFNNYGIEKMSEKMDGGSPTAFTYAMVWGGLRGYAYTVEDNIAAPATNEGKATFAEIVKNIDALPKEIKAVTIESVTKVLTETQNYKDLIEAGEEVEGEKKTLAQNNEPSQDTSSQSVD